MPNSSRFHSDNPVNIRRAALADLADIRRLEAQAPTAAHWSSTQYEALFGAEGLQRLVLVVVNEVDHDDIVGFLIARCLPGEWEIENLVVAGNARQRGTGWSLVRALEHEALAAGVESITLEVRESNLPARRLYEKIGFTFEGRRKGYYQSPGDDAILYRLPLRSCDKMP